MKPVKETIFSSKIHKAFFANIRNECVFSVTKNKQYSYAIRVWALSSWFPFHLQITGKRKLYKFHRNRKWVLNMQVYYFFLSMCTLYGVCAIWARICSTSEAYHQYQWGFLVQVKCIISKNEIWSAGNNNNKKRSHTQLDSRKQVIAFQDRVITINIKEAQHPLKWEKQVIDKSSIMLKISTKSMHRVLVWEIGPANNTTRCSRLSKRRLLHAWHPSQLAINLSIDKSKWQIHVNNKSD